MAFKNILGNERQKKILRRALQKGRLPNSMLFCGQEGIGKKSIALVLAKALNCISKKDDACETCSACRAINKNNFPDVMVISPEGNIIKIGQMRILKQTAYLRPMVGKKRVFIVTEAEKMNEEASNSLLKILEEPPLFSHIILITTNPEMIRATIKSRCQILNFQPILREEIEKILLKKGFSAKRAKVISLLVKGNLKKALHLDWEKIQSRREEAWQFFVSFVMKKNVASYLNQYSARQGLTRDELEQNLEILSSFCRDLVLLQQGSNPHLLMNPDYAQKMIQLKDFISWQKSVDCLQIMDYNLYALQKNLNINLLISSLFSNLME